MDSERSKPAGRSPLALLVVVLLELGVTGLLFALASRVQWTPGKLYWSLLGVAVGAMFLCLVFWNPVVIKRRMRLGPGTKSWDFIFLAVFAGAIIGLWMVADSDLGSRGGAPALIDALWLTGAAAFVFGWILVTWSMGVNPFFEKTVRIQTDHGHRVIDRGPYAYVRHPGYVGFNSVLLATPALLASAWTMIAAGVAVRALVIRTNLEDRTLQAELKGYAEYAARVRYRLVPGVW